MRRRRQGRWRSVAVAASLVTALLLVAGGPAGASPNVVRPSAVASCTFDAQSGLVTGVKPGDELLMDCQGFAPSSLVGVLEASPLYFSTGSSDDLDGAATSFSVSSSSGGVVGLYAVPNPFTAPDPAAACPPTAAQVQAGLVHCSLLVEDSAGNRTTVALDYSGQPELFTGMAALPDGDGYWLCQSDGAVTTHGDALPLGSMAGKPLNAPIEHLVSAPNGLGYWLVAADGGIFNFGSAGFYGSTGAMHLNAPVVDMAPTADGKGYWLVASDGGVFTYGDAHYWGSTGAMHLTQPVVGIVADDATGGYWLVAADGGVFAFHAPYLGSTGAIHLNQPVVGMAATADDAGYWFVAADGGVFTYGDARFWGSAGSLHLSAPVVGMAADSATGGYWLVGSDGGIFAYHAPFDGSA